MQASRLQTEVRSHWDHTVLDCTRRGRGLTRLNHVSLMTALYSSRSIISATDSMLPPSSRPHMPPKSPAKRSLPTSCIPRLDLWRSTILRLLFPLLPLLLLVLSSSAGNYQTAFTDQGNFWICHRPTPRL